MVMPPYLPSQRTEGPAPKLQARGLPGGHTEWGFHHRYLNYPHHPHPLPTVATPALRAKSRPLPVPSTGR